MVIRKIDSKKTFGPGLKSLGGEEIAQAQRRLGQELPLDARPRIEIEHQGIGVLDVVDRGVPGMQFDGADAHKTQEAVQAVTVSLRYKGTPMRDPLAP